MSSILISCRNKPGIEKHYLPALRRGGWTGEVKVASCVEPQPPAALLLEGVAGLLLTGGDDIHPRHWDPAEPLHLKAEVDGPRDDFEIPLIRAAWQRGIPIFGICRGEQILNVALGGSMIQDVPDHFNCETDRHSHGTPDQPELRHSVAISPGTRLAEALGATDIQVNSRHHQAVRQVAPVLKAAAFHPETSAPDGPLIEGIESTDAGRWAIGVQWHPENLVGQENGAGAAARRLFEAFVQAVRAHSSEVTR